MNGSIDFQVQLIFICIIQFMFLDVRLKQYFWKGVILKEDI